MQVIMEDGSEFTAEWAKLEPGDRVVVRFNRMLRDDEIMRFSDYWGERFADIPLALFNASAEVAIQKGAVPHQTPGDGS